MNEEFTVKNDYIWVMTFKGQIITSMSLDNPLREWNLYSVEGGELYIIQEILYSQGDEHSNAKICLDEHDIFDFLSELDDTFVHKFMDEATHHL